MSSIRHYTQIQKRLLFLEAVILVAALVVEGRLVYLQVFKHGDFSRMAYHQQYTPKETAASRGVIEDRSGAVLAMNIDLYDVCAHPNQIADKAGAAAALSRALGLPYGAVLSKISGDKPFVWVERQVPYDRSDEVAQMKLEGVEATKEQKRFYPDHQMAAHVLGFAGLDNQGLDGLERYYNGALTGQKGLVLAERDARGRAVLADDKAVKQNQDGLNIVTTLDETIQHIAQVELAKAFEKYRCKAASIVVMDPHTGEILALANYPEFDPNHFAEYPKDYWNDRVVNDEFEPGSTFKLVAAAGALEEGVVNEDDKFFCENGAFHTDYGRTVTDHEKFGWLTFREIFGYSSNIGMVKVGYKLGKDNLYRYCKRFGFGDFTGIDLPGEAKGTLRPPEKWSGLSLTSIPYGYEVSATPIQVLQAYAAVANGGVMMKPYIVKAWVNSDGKTVKETEPKKIRRTCSAKTAARLTEMMKWVVENGTGTAVALPNYSIAGKTGTAYKFMNGHYSKYNYVSSFVGFVPAEKPRFVIYVSLDDPRGLYWGGYTAGPVFKEVAKRALAYALVPGSAPDTAVVQDNGKRGMPSFVGLTPAQCQWLAQRNGLRLKFDGKGERVVDQSVKTGSPLALENNKSLRVQLTLGEDPATQAHGIMPDIRGKTKRQVLALLAPLGIKVNFKGEGVVMTQYPPAGRSVQSGILCEAGCDFPITKASPASAGGNS